MKSLVLNLFVKEKACYQCEYELFKGQPFSFQREMSRSESIRFRLTEQDFKTEEEVCINVLCLIKSYVHMRHKLATRKRFHCLFLSAGSYLLIFHEIQVSRTLCDCKQCC